jgi:hypothetical protein
MEVVLGGIAKQIGSQQGSDVIGTLVAEAVKAASTEGQISQLQKQVAHLTKLVHILWKEAEKLERTVKVTPEGLRIKTGLSELLVLTNGGIILDGQRILLKTPGKDELMY